MDKILSLENICKSYDEAGKKTAVLNGIDFSLNTGEFVVLFGPSGSGKSTLLHLIGMLDIPTCGSIIFNSQNVSKLNEKEKSALRLNKIGFVFQFDSLLAEFSLWENVDMPAAIAQKPSREEAVKIMSHFGLGEMADKMPQQISGGEKQRISLARALRNDPSLILADEPTGNLDQQNTLIVLEDFKKLAQRGISVIMATHNREAAKYGTRIINLSDGKLT
ncbi:MAG: ABC transporter ATP-binding protein [Elusimicrobia bacterium]|nr:ABC transporter ATP-binding protein [Elusimicrobiota bacterium]